MEAKFIKDSAQLGPLSLSFRRACTVDRKVTDGDKVYQLYFIKDQEMLSFANLIELAYYNLYRKSNEYIK